MRYLCPKVRVAFLYQTELLLKCEVGWKPEREWVRLSAKCLDVRQTRVDRKGGRQGGLHGPSPFLGPILALPPFSQTSFDFRCFPSCLRPVPQGLGFGARSDRLNSSSQAPSKLPWLGPTSSETLPKTRICVDCLLGFLKAEPEHAWVQMAYFGDKPRKEDLGRREVR